MGQLYQHVWPVLWVGQPHFNSVFNLRGHSAILFYFSHDEVFNLKEYVYKHACVMFVNLYDGKEGEHRKPHRLGQGTDTPTWHHSQQVTGQWLDL